MYKENDFELIYFALQDDYQAVEKLIEKYQNLIWNKINAILSHYHPPGVERDDLYQEGTIAVYRAIYTFRTDYNVPFYSFVKVCIDRQLRSFIRKFNSQASRQFYFSKSLDFPVNEDEGFYLYDVVEATNEASAFEKYWDDLCNLIRSGELSDFENSILLLKIMGYSYDEISRRLLCKKKQIDNTIQKIKRMYS